MAVDAKNVVVAKTVPSAPINKGCCANLCRPTFASNSPETLETIIVMPESETDEKSGPSKKGPEEQVVRKKIREDRSSKSTKSRDKTSSNHSSKRSSKSKKSDHKDKSGKKHTENKIKCCGASCSSSYNLFSWFSGGNGGPMSFKQGALLFGGGVAAGVGAALLFFKTGGAAAAAVGGLAGLGVSTAAKSDIKGSNNTVVGSGSNSLININQVKGGSEKGADEAHKLTFAGMSEELKLECLKRGMIYIDPATSAWWGYDSVGAHAKCLVNIPDNMIKGQCRLWYQNELLLQQEAKGKFDLTKSRIDLEHQLEMLNQKNKFAGGTGDGIEYNWLGIPINKNKFTGKRSVPNFKEQPQSKGQPKKPTPTQQARMEFLNATRGEEANQTDYMEGLKWLKKAAGKK